VNWEFRVHISNFIGEVSQAFHGRQAQVPSLRGWVLIQHNRRLRHVSDIDPPCVDSVQLKLLTWLIKWLILHPLELGTTGAMCSLQICSSDVML
jgi:hypothetical protein